MSAETLRRILNSHTTEQNREIAKQAQIATRRAMREANVIIKRMNKAVEKELQKKKGKKP